MTGLWTSAARKRLSTAIDRRQQSAPHRHESRKPPRRGGGRSPGSPLREAQQRLDLQIVLEAEAAELAPVAGLLVAAERQRPVERRAVVVDAARPQPVG